MITDFSYRNNGLDAFPPDTGRGLVTGNPNDYYKFKVPSLRNLKYSAPYMHDGRFATLDDVVSHYSFGVEESFPNLSVDINVDPATGQAGGQYTPQERKELKALLMTFTDEEFINNPVLVILGSNVIIN